MALEILVVDDHPGTIQIIGKAIHGLGRIRFATDGASALELMRETAADLVLLDAEMPGMDGFEVLRRLRADAEWQDVPVIMVTAHGNPATELRGLELGASDFIGKPVNPPLLVARARTQLRVKLLTDRLRDSAQLDGLTEVKNRRGFDHGIERELRRCLRNGLPLGLLMVDVDHFKRYNDRYGHVAGDLCLRRIAQALTASVRRPGDFVARYGGEEFALVLPATDEAGTRHVAERVLDRIASLALAHADAPSGRVSASVGAAVTPGGEVPLRSAHAVQQQVLTLLQAADDALYAAKRGGRGRYMIAPFVVRRAADDAAHSATGACSR